MRTRTRARIVEILRDVGELGPSRLARELRVSNQAVHRHLRSLVEAGVLERRGSPPRTRYAIAGAPDLTHALAWYRAVRPEPASEVCDTRDRFSARLSQFLPLEKRGVSGQDLPLMIAVTGEVGNNSFDHNLGQWDVPGCWFELQVTRGRVWVLIADRGQGIRDSLAKVVPDLTDDQAAVEMAFRVRISGRSPEQRGNGLKFVRNAIESGTTAGIACRSGAGRVFFGELGETCSAALASITANEGGTITLLAWGFHATEA